MFTCNSHIKKCFNSDCLYQSTDFKSLVAIMPAYSDDEFFINKLAEFKKSPHLSRINTNLLQSVNPIVKVPKDERSITRYIDISYIFIPTFHLPFNCIRVPSTSFSEALHLLPTYLYAYLLT